MNRLITNAIAAAAIGLFAVVSTAEAVTQLRIGFGNALQGPVGDAVKKMAEVVKQGSNGEIELVLFPAAQLGGDVAMFTQVRSGNLDLVLFGSNIVSSLEPRLHVLDLPFIWKSRDTFWNVLNGPVGQKLLDRLSDKGIKGLAWGTFGTRGLINSGYQINKPEDLKGKRIRVAESDLYVKTVQSLGGSPVPVAWPEVYTALQQKAVDSIETGYFAFVESKLYEVATSLAVTNHINVAALFVMNQPKFNSLSPAHQRILVEAAREGGKTMREGINKSGDDAIAFMKQKGLTVTTPDMAAFAARVQPVYDFFAPRIGPDLIAEVKAAQ